MVQTTSAVFEPRNDKITAIADIARILDIIPAIFIVGATAAIDPPDLATATPGTEITFPVPAGTEPGDQAWVVMSDSSNGFPTPPAGFELVNFAISQSSTLYRNTNIPDPVPISYTWTVDVPGRARSGVMVVVRGAEKDAGVVSVETSTIASNISLTIPTFDTPAGAALLMLSTSLGMQTRDMEPAGFGDLVKLVEHGATEAISYGQTRNAMATIEEKIPSPFPGGRTILFDGSSDQVLFGVFLIVDK